MMRIIDCLVMHCSDSPDSADVDVNEIRRWHTDKPPQGRGWDDVGYHYVIRRSGTIEAGRMESVVGAHAEGFNSHSIGICWVGKDAQSEAQHASMIRLLRDLMARYKLMPTRVFGHCELNHGKTCPNLDLGALRAELIPTAA